MKEVMQRIMNNNTEKKKDLSTFKNIFKTNYFDVIDEGGDFISAMSKNTGHCWLLKYAPNVYKRPYILYHKHTLDTKRYHLHWNTYSLWDCMREITDHDNYILKKAEEEKGK